MKRYEKPRTSKAKLTRKILKMLSLATLFSLFLVLPTFVSTGLILDFDGFGNDDIITTYSAADLNTPSNINFNIMFPITDNRSHADEPIPLTHSTIICETTAASPILGDVQEVINDLKNRGRSWCRQTNCFVSKCTTLARYKSAAAAICSECWLMIQCEYAAGSLNNIREKCKAFVDGEWRVGGKAVYSQGSIEVYHN